MFHNAHPIDKLRIWPLTMKKSNRFQDKKKVKKGSLLTNWLVFTRETKALIRENKKEKNNLFESARKTDQLSR
ncbi:MAG: hypothetical protein DRP02_03120 [Candidatus Gerdarchaeota archaeon]|nr:MAG: hypothetical protein DRP02_03120 [Candidatus Gerdarchaeota archaeon]